MRLRLKLWPIIFAAAMLASFSLSADTDVPLPSADATLLNAATQGNAGAQAKLAKLYHDGQGVPRDYARRAASWFSKAVEQADAGTLDGLMEFYFLACILAVIFSPLVWIWCLFEREYYKKMYGVRWYKKELETWIRLLKFRFEKWRGEKWPNEELFGNLLFLTVLPFVLYFFFGYFGLLCVTGCFNSIKRRLVGAEELERTAEGGDVGAQIKLGDYYWNSLLSKNAVFRQLTPA